MEASWVEDLDVDDSDLHSHTLLRRCKRQRCTDRNTSVATTTTTSISQSETLDPSPSPSKTLNSVPQILTSAHQAEELPQSSTIPGPAGIVQVAKLRKTRDKGNWLGQEDQLMATQEYIRKVVEDPEEDGDFQRNPWISAVEYLYPNGVHSPSASLPLGEINKNQKNGKLDQVVAVIKSCAPNELGDMTVKLKDPTGTISGTIHHKVLTEGDFRKGICVGSVLILHNVSVFSPSRSTHYLNITKRNLGKVFYKDGGSSEQLTFHGSIDATPHSGTPTLPGVLSHERVAANGLTKRSNINKKQENIIDNPKTSNKLKELLKEANVKENVGQLIQNGFKGTQALPTEWTDEQLHELELDF